MTERPLGVTEKTATTEPGTDARKRRFDEASLNEQARVSGRGQAALQTIVYPALTLILLVGLWEVLTRLLKIPPYLLPPPSAIAGEMFVRRAALLDHGLVTMFEVLAGFAISVVVAVPLAVAIAYSRLFERSIYALLVGSQTIPKVAVAPLFLVWFGFGWTPKIMIASLIAFFPIVVSTVVGLKATPPEMFYLARSLGASPWQTFYLVRLPNALPSIFGGLKVAITFAVIGAIVGEFVGAEKGLGYLIQFSMGYLDIKLLFAAITALTLMGIGLFFVVDLIERLMLPWHVSKRAEGLQMTL